jgi:integrase
MTGGPLDFAGNGPGDSAHFSDPASVAIADILHLYARDKGSSNARPRELMAMITRLNAFWGEYAVADVKGVTCREYARQRAAKIAARNELSLMRAAIRHWHREHTLTVLPMVTLPSPNPSRVRWLQRAEAARLLWCAWRACQTMPPGRTKRASRPQAMQGGRTARATARHLARLILIGLYTGTRPGAILSLHWEPNDSGGWVDLQAGVLYRRRDNERQTRKRKPPVRISRKLLAHLRRWKRIDDALPPRHDSAGRPLPRSVVHWNGEPVTKVNKAFRHIVANAGLGPEVTPHVLRHTRATWMMQAGVDRWEAAGSLGMTVDMLESVYGHHHPDFQKHAADAY